MAGIVFHFEEYDRDVYSGRRIDFDAWRYAAKAAGDIDKMIVVDKTGLQFGHPGGEIEFSVVNELPELEGKVAYMVCPWNNVKSKTSLWDFDHNVDWYVFGPASGWGEMDEGIYIPQASEVASHAIHIANVVLMHRYKVRSM